MKIRDKENGKEGRETKWKEIKQTNKQSKTPGRLSVTGVWREA
jgi:hypothetical protein